MLVGWLDGRLHVPGVVILCAVLRFWYECGGRCVDRNSVNECVGHLILAHVEWQGNAQYFVSLVLEMLIAWM